MWTETEELILEAVGALIPDDDPEEPVVCFTACLNEQLYLLLSIGLHIAHDRTIVAVLGDKKLRVLRSIAGSEWRAHDPVCFPGGIPLHSWQERRLAELIAAAPWSPCERDE